MILLGIVSAALFYGDAMITPALSVLSAVEGLKIVTPAFEPYVVPLTVVILVGAVRRAVARHRAASRRCSARSRWSGSSRSAIAGLWHIAQNPGVLRAFNPRYGVSFLLATA